MFLNKSLGFVFTSLQSYSHINHAAFLMSAFMSLLKDLNLVQSLPLPVFLALA